MLEELDQRKKVTLGLTAIGFFLLVLLECYFMRPFSKKGLDEDFCQCEQPKIRSSRMFNGRIVNGSEVSGQHLRWLSTVYTRKILGSNSSKTIEFKSVCTSSILTASWHLTSAQCFNDSNRDLISELKNNQNLQLWSTAGHNSTAALFIDAYHRKIDENKIYLAPEYRAEIDVDAYLHNKLDELFETSQYAIALFKLDTPFVFSHTIRPACLYEKKLNKFENLMFAGFGRLSTETIPEILNYSDIEVEGDRLEILYMSVVEKVDQCVMAANHYKTNVERFENLVCVKSKTNIAIKDTDTGTGLLSLIENKLYFMAVLTISDLAFPFNSTIGFASFYPLIGWMNSLIDEDRCLVDEQSWTFGMNSFGFFILVAVTCLMAASLLFLIYKSNEDS